MSHVRHKALLSFVVHRRAVSMAIEHVYVKRRVVARKY